MFYQKKNFLIFCDGTFQPKYQEISYFLSKKKSLLFRDKNIFLKKNFGFIFRDDF